MRIVAEDVIAQRLAQAARLLAALIEQRAGTASATERRAFQKRCEAAARRDAYITRLLAETPPLSEEDKAYLSRLLTDPRPSDPSVRSPTGVVQRPDAG